MRADMAEDGLYVAEFHLKGPYVLMLDPSTGGLFDSLSERDFRVSAWPCSP